MEGGMSENLVSASTVLLFGRVVEDLEIKPAADSGGLVRLGVDQPLQEQLEPEDPESKPSFARIYAFSYEGHYYDLAKPALFLVHGQGTNVQPTAEHTGLVTETHEFSTDIKVWAYDKSDLSIRLDPETGTFEQILLEAEITPERTRVQYSGQGVRFSGQGVRFSGQGVRFSGQGARARGTRGSDD
jgi:hypothetical protein